MGSEQKSVRGSKDEARGWLTCAVLFGIPVWWIAGVLVGLEGGALALFIVVCFGGTLVALAANAESKAKQEVASRRRAKSAMRNSAIRGSEFEATHQFMTDSGSGFIQVDESRMKVRIGGQRPGSGRVSARTVEIGEVLDVGVQEDSRGLMGSELGNTLGMAAVGGLLFGKTGAVVGAIAGQDAKTVSQVCLVVAVDDLSTPFISLNYLDDEVLRGSDEHQAAVAEATKWMGVIRVLLSRREAQSSPRRLDQLEEIEEIEDGHN